jgi:hypothetical protein
MTSRLTFTEVMNVTFGSADLEPEVRITGTHDRGMRPVYFGAILEPGEPASFTASSVMWRFSDREPWTPMPQILVDQLGDAIDQLGLDAYAYECEAAEERRAEAQRERELFGDAAE